MGNLKDAGYTQFTAFGFNDTGLRSQLPFDVWEESVLYPFPAAAQPTTIQSDEDADTLAGAGARTVRIIGLDNDYAEIREIVEMDGQNPVTLANQYLRINRVRVRTAGASGFNVGKITVQHGATVIGSIRAEFGQSQSAIYTVPNDVVQSAWLVLVTAAVGKKDLDATGYFRFLMRPFGAAWITMGPAFPASNGGFDKLTLPVWTPLARKTDLRVEIFGLEKDQTLAAAGFQIAIIPRRVPEL